MVVELGTVSQGIRRRLKVQTQQSFTVYKLTLNVPTQITLCFLFTVVRSTLPADNTQFPDSLLRLDCLRAEIRLVNMLNPEPTFKRGLTEFYIRIWVKQALCQLVIVSSITLLGIVLKYLW